VPQPPKFQPRRRNARSGPLSLPASGRKGPLPVWPLEGKPLPAESIAWKQLWATPQAVAWETLGWFRTVARYCRTMVAAEQPGARADLLNAVGALEDRLGLTPKAMRLLLWTIGDDESELDLGPDDGKVLDIRQRIKAVDQ
jgi:hypothetical protein